uniref:RING-type domain-containing protein n=1 Tax=viral metagenome TaxID=1070528 RepID=A0A6C0KCH2_9ZZZZ
MSSSNNIYYLQQLLTTLNSRYHSHEVQQPREDISASRIFSSAFSTFVTRGLQTYMNRPSGSSVFDTFLQFYFDNTNENNMYDDDENIDYQNANSVHNIATTQYKGRVTSLAEIEPGNECAICFEEFDETSRIALTDCDHCYHIDCINKWYIQNQTCPICRNKI